MFILQKQWFALSIDAVRILQDIGYEADEDGGEIDDADSIGDGAGDEIKSITGDSESLRKSYETTKSGELAVSITTLTTDVTKTEITTTATDNCSDMAYVITAANDTTTPYTLPDNETHGQGLTMNINTDKNTDTTMDMHFSGIDTNTITHTGLKVKTIAGINPEGTLYPSHSVWPSASLLTDPRRGGLMYSPMVDAGELLAYSVIVFTML